MFSINAQKIQINPSVIIQKNRQITFNYQLYSEDFDEETSIFRKLCLLPYEPIWYYFVIILGLINSLSVMLQYINVIVKSEEYEVPDLIYFCDLVWCLNTSLLLINRHVQNLKTIQIPLPRRKLLWLLIDYLSIVPIERFSPLHLKPYLALNKTLKIIYIMFVFRFVNTMLESSILLRIFQMICELLYFMIVVTLVFAELLINYYGIKDLMTVMHLIVFMFDHMTGIGFGMVVGFPIINKIVVIIGGLIVFVGVLVLSTANVTFLFFTKSIDRNAFRYKYNCALDQVKRMGMNSELTGCLEIVFDSMWTLARGMDVSVGGRRKCNQESQTGILPKTFSSEISIDMCTSIFKHSLLLKKLPVAFLRDLSACVQYEVYVQYQLICKLGEVKDRMIYVHRGVIEIISDEDGETPMMQLAAGTCISEACLYIPYKSNFLVRCSTTCILHILYREDFQRMVLRYPGIYKQLKLDVEDRIQNGRQLKAVQNFYNSRADRQKKCTNVSWLMFKLHKMTALAHPHVAAQHSLANFLMERIINEERFKNHIFSPHYLTLYAVPEEQQDYNDTLFDKSTFPYILKPHTGLTLFWEIIIAIAALLAAFLIPYMALVYSNQTTLFNTVYLFSGIWFIDIIVQLRILIIYEKRKVSGFLDVLIMKLTGIVFLLDILSVVPVELFGAVFFYEKYRNCIYMNRILKLARIVKLLAKWEEKYNSNPLLVRFIYAIFFIIYGTFIIACVFYCFDDKDNQDETTFRNLLFFASQMLTGVSLWVESCDRLDYAPLFIVLYVVICTAYSVIYGAIFSAYASVRFNTSRIKHNTKALIQAAVEIDPRYDYYIQDVMRDAITVDKGFSLQCPDYLYKTLPREFLGYFYKASFADHMKKLPLFNGLSHTVLQKMFEEGGNVHTYNAHEVLFHVGDLWDELLLLMRGTCEVLDGVTFKSNNLTSPLELNSVEVVLTLPMRTTVITLTHCTVVSIKYSVMRRVIFQLKPKKSIHRPLSGLRDIRSRIQHAEIKYFNPDLLDVRKKDLYVQSHVYFSRINSQYLNAYKDLAMFKLRWIFMNLSFCPSGKFLEMWEMARCVCAILSAIFFTSITFCFYRVPHPMGVIKWTLEVMAAIDIYIRLHVAYYDEYGILITHPGKTIIHYIKHGFVIDLIAALPLHVFISRAEYVIININKVLQLHRYFSFVKYKRNHKVVPLRMIYMFAQLPAIVVTINIVATILLLHNCKTDMTKPIKDSVLCEKGSIWDAGALTDPMVAHLHALYVVWSIISKIAIQGFTVQISQMIFVTLISFIGFCLNIISAASIFGFFINEYVDIMYNHIKMKVLMTFILRGEHSTSSTLILEAKSYIYRMWTMDRNNIHKHSKHLPWNLRRDMLYNKYSPVLNKSLLGGVTGIQALVRNLLVKSEYRIFEGNGLIQRVNDICEHTIILYSGLIYIDVLVDKVSSPEECAKTCVSLGPGSIIGNLCPLKYNKLKQTMVAIGVVELLYIDSNTFFEILQHFPVCQEEYRKLRLIHITHVPGKADPQHEIQGIARKRKFSGCRIIKITRFEDAAFIILNILSFLGAYVPQFLFFYSVIIQMNPMNQYFLITDALFIVAIVLVFLLPITNEKGEMMSYCDIINKCFKRYIFYLSIFGCVPFYFSVSTLLAIGVPYANLISRCNVLLRNFFFFRIIEISIARAPAIMFAVTFLSNVLIILLAISGATALLLLLYDIGKDLDADPLYRYELLANHLYEVTNMFTHTSQPYYHPEGGYQIIIYIVMMSLCMVYTSVIYSTVVCMVQAVQQFKLSYLTEKNCILALMQRSDTSSVLEDRLAFYCKMTWKNRQGFKIPELFLELPLYLQETMYEDLFGKIFDTHEFFGQIHYDLRRQIYRKLQLEYYYHGDFIVYEGTINGTMYFILKGNVVSLRYFGNDTVQFLEKGKSFAMMEGITKNMPHQYSYRAVNDSVILLLVKEDWDYMLHFYPASKRIIDMVAIAIYKPHFD